MMLLMLAVAVWKFLMPSWATWGHKKRPNYNGFPREFRTNQTFKTFFTWFPRKPRARATHVTRANRDRQHLIGLLFLFLAERVSQQRVQR